MTTDNNKEIDTLISEFWDNFSMYDLGYKSEGDLVEQWVRQALTSYADKRVREERKRLLSLIAQVESVKPESNGRYNACREMRALLEALTHQDNE